MKIGIGGLSSLTDNYISALQLAAHSAPLEIEVSTSLIRAVSWDALVLPGGGDIHPALLPGHPAADPRCSDIDPVLDREQLALLELFVLAQKPVLGICKGMQLIQLYFGGSFCQHLPTAEAHSYKQYDQLHITHALPGSFLHSLYGPHFVVNSAHHQGVLLHTDGIRPVSDTEFADKKALQVIQWTPDGVVEGIIHTSLPIIGLQWHPERLCFQHARPDAVDGSQVLRHFLSLL